MRPFYNPGVITKMAFGLYSEKSLAKQQILSDIAYAAAYGFAQTRIVSPGVEISAETVEGRLRQVKDAWEYETTRSPGTVGFDPFASLTKPEQEYLAVRLLGYPQTDSAFYPQLEERRRKKAHGS